MFTLDNFYTSKEDLENSPSRKDGVDRATEMNQCNYGVQLMQMAGIRLELPQTVVVTSSVLFHRFYTKQSLRKYQVKKVACACLWLAAKIEEEKHFSTFSLLAVFHRITRRTEGRNTHILDEEREYPALKKDLIKFERIILIELNFILHVEKPHKFLLNYMTLVLLTSSAKAGDNPSEQDDNFFD